ncbi:monovalent cation/H+ antiporter complex subunit F [Streptomyces sp. TP-A0874]|uniref:monovalent cation/H+ antiporter complex subunit F n=1 Tax=Streptomyces sp. TP-A0874 TaxID=549819 RepID=UPI0008539426|nr:monovalent cation/H+ antiporter complex subunit F [Streptomyces sp. TP-A0874]
MSPSDGWLVAALAGLLALLPVLWRMAVAAPRERLVAQNLTTLLGGLVLLLAGQGFQRPAYTDLALLLAVLGPAGTLVYSRFLGGLPRSALVSRVAWSAVPATLLALGFATGPGRALVKLLLIGGLLIAGSVVTSTGTRAAVSAQRGSRGGVGAAGGG